MEFMYSIPSVVNFGEGASKKIGEMVMGFGAKKVLCVYDLGVKNLAGEIVHILQESGLTVIAFDGVLPNPPDTIVEEAARTAKEANVDIIVAVGGGSSMDCAKAINILLTNPSPINQYDGLNLVKNPTKPLIAIPTTSGTGSEVTSFTIITDTTRLKKMVIGGQFVGATVALADPLLTLGLPPAVTAATGMDALTHAVEAYVSKGASIPTDVNALKAISLIAENLVEATNNGSNIEARTNMLLGSMMAGFAFNSAVLGLVHSIAHPLSVHCGLPHGVANACGLPHVMEYNAEVVPDRTIDIGVAMGLELEGLSKEEAVTKVIAAVKELSAKVKIPTLKEAGVQKEQFDRIAEDAMQEISTLFNPRETTKEEIIEILEKAY